MVKKKFKIGTHTIQLVIVMAGVFFGMLLTEWNNNRKTDHETQMVLKGIKGELIKNKMHVERSYNARKPFYKSYDSLYSTLPTDVLREKFSQRPFDERLPNWKGLGGVMTLQNSMFESAKYSGTVANIDITLLQQLSQTYNHQEITNDLRKQILTLITSLDENLPYQTVLNRLAIMSELGSLDAQLIKQYEECIKLIEDSE